MNLFFMKNLRVMAILGAGVVTACSTVGTELTDSRQTDTELRACAAQFERFDQATEDVADGEAARIADFPYLRVNRLLASYTEKSLSKKAFETWVAHLQRLDRDARAIEWKNLSKQQRNRLKIRLSDLNRCAKIMKRHDFADPQHRSLLKSRARVPDSYNRFAQVAGLYPLAVIPIRFGIMSLHQSQQDDLQRTKPFARSHIFKPQPSSPYDPAEIETLFRRMKRDALGIPVMDEQARQRLLDAFAPVFEIESKSDDDQPGRPAYAPNGELRVDTSDPVLYQRIAFTRFKDRVLVQLVYTIWFPARTKAGAFDIFAGPLDGLVWRATLDEAGRPMIYDAIHPCGCYHLFFPVRPWRLRSAEEHGFHAEPPLAPVPGPPLKPNSRLKLRLKAGTHYLAGIETISDSPQKAKPYRLADESRLRSLAHPRGRKSLYQPDGLIPVSERPERFLLWPMGVPSAGAMRQWGHHATAFIGTRHFDDADLIERILTRPLSTR